MLLRERRCHPVSHSLNVLFALLPLVAPGAAGAQSKSALSWLRAPPSRVSARSSSASISEDFNQRDRFVLPLEPQATAGHVLRGLQLDGEGHVHVRLVPDGNDPHQNDTRILRVQLPSP